MSGERILLVEDNPMNRRLEEFLLKASGYIVYEACDGTEALEIARSHVPELILMDLQLPGLDGFAATRMLKSDAKTEKIPVVALTAYAMGGDAEKAAEAGFDGYITKPINPDEFCGTVAKYLRTVGSSKTKDRDPSAGSESIAEAQRTHDAPPSSAAAGDLERAEIATLEKLAGALGHEVRNILGAFGTSVQILRRSEKLTDADAELIGILETGWFRLNDIVQALSVFRPDVPEFQEFDLKDFVEANLSAFRSENASRKPPIVISAVFDPELRCVRADKDQLTRVLRILVQNAVDTLKAGGDIVVQTDRIESEHRWRLSVSDNGRGIDSSVLPHIFKPFYSTDRHRIGLGLPGARYIVEKHFGSLTVQNRPGRGSCFCISMPLNPEN